MKTLTEEDAQKIVVHLNENDYFCCKAEVLPEYSGRGMMGKTCLAIVLHSSSKVYAATTAAWVAGHLGIPFHRLPVGIDDFGKDSVVWY